MKYTIKQTAVYDGKELKAGDTISAEDLRPSVLEPALRVGNIVPSDDYEPPQEETPAEQPSPVIDVQAPEANDGDDKPISDGSLASLGVPIRFVKALADNDPPIVTIDEALDYIDQHGTFAGVNGIGKKTDETLRDMLAAAID